MRIRYEFPMKYKSAALARGDIYLADELEECCEEMLDPQEKERLNRQRRRREIIGASTKAWYDKENGMFHYELTKAIESDREEER